MPFMALNKLLEVIEMIIAVAYNQGEIFQHFGHTEQFKLYTVDGEKLFLVKL